jgi:hypothetical protein
MNPFIQQLFNAARNTAERAFTGYGVQSLRNMGPQVRRAAGDGILNRYAHPIVSAAKKDPSRLTAAVKGTLAAPGAKPALVYIGGAAGVSAANKTGLTGAIEGGLNQVGPGLDRFFGAVPPNRFKILVEAWSNMAGAHLMVLFQGDNSSFCKHS